MMYDFYHSFYTFNSAETIYVVLYSIVSLYSCVFARSFTCKEEVIAGYSIVLCLICLFLYYMGMGFYLILA